ncbi:MAG: heme-binding protein [Candidatus Obscuribacterales bacterium]|nr:heme-binding protein [Candidatus Obscuribacterales bacterium]
MRRGILISIGVVSILSAVAFSSRSEASTREVPYQVKDSDHSFEIREYPSRIVAEVEVSGARERALSEAFQTLAGYLFGKSRPKDPVALSKSVSDRNAKVKLTMTVPVTTQSVGNDGQTIKMRFFMPPEYSMDKLPIPDDKRVKVFELPAQRIAVLKFSGSARKDNFDRHLITLRKMLDSRGLSPTGEPYEAYYNPPFTPIFLKRNEICIPF